MRLIPQRLEGVQLIKPERHHDARGWFQRTFDAEVCAEFGLDPNVATGALAYNARKGTVRGMHWQEAPYEEAKWVSCLKGGIFDVVVDLRPGSSTYLEHVSVELWGMDGKVLYVPPGFAHGYQTLADDTLVSYVLSAPYSESHARRAPFDDPCFRIHWPLPVSMVSPADRAAPQVSP